jgi:hypothetical protein
MGKNRATKASRVPTIPDPHANPAGGSAKAMGAIMEPTPPVGSRLVVAIVAKSAVAHPGTSRRSEKAGGDGRKAATAAAPTGTGTPSNAAPASRTTTRCPRSGRCTPGRTSPRCVRSRSTAARTRSSFATAPTPDHTSGQTARSSRRPAHRNVTNASPSSPPNPRVKRRTKPTKQIPGRNLGLNLQGSSGTRAGAG